MKALTVVALTIVAGASGYLIKVPLAPISEPTFAPSGWIHLQKLVLPLFQNVCEESTDPVIRRLSVEFTSNLSASDFWDPEVLTSFQKLKSGKGFLPKGQIFSEYNTGHTDELKIVYDVMHNAKNFDTFYKVAAWARQNLNCGLYVNLIYLALENRRDTEKLTLPPPYELLPNYFIRKDIIIQGSSLLAGEEFTPSEGVRDEGNAYTLDANYTANFYDNDDESKLAYFREDIGLNSYHFLRMLKLAPWLNRNVDINSRYGEEMYNMMKQLVARYNLERYSNGMFEQDNLSWNSLSDAPYDPMLVYSNGNEFIHRTSPVQLPENEDKVLLQTIENNIATVVSHMREAGYNKTQILNHLMEILVTGERSYDKLARVLLGKTLSNNGEPTVFDHYMTSLRDPMTWRLYKKIVDLIDNALQVLPPYTKSELYFPGVELMSVDIKKVMTNFDYFEFDITEALKIGNGDTTFQVKIGQPRLNHKPFIMKLNISSLVTQKGLLKIYLGPKMMPGEFAKKKNMFNLLDSFEINLKKGSNIVSRSSNDMIMFSPDFTSLQTLRKKVEDAQFGLDALPLNSVDSQIGFPERLMVPKGTPEGLPVQLFVFIAPFMKSTIGAAYTATKMDFNPAVLSPLFPLDLTMEDGVLLDLPNAILKDFMITHKGISKVSNYGGSGATNSWYDKTNSPPPKPNVYASGNEAFDYNSRAVQYGQNDISLQRNDQYIGSQDLHYYDGVQNDDSYSDRATPNLKVSGYEYSSKQKQPYDYKSKRPQYQKTDYSANKVDYKSLYQNKTLQKDTDTVNNQNLKEKVVVNGNNQEGQNIYNVDQNVNEENDRIPTEDSSVEVKHYILKSTAFNSFSKQKEPTDYKSKHLKLDEKPDYKTTYKNTWKTTEKPADVETNYKMSKQILVNENETNNDSGTFGNVKNVEVFKIFKDSNKIDSPKEISNTKHSDLFIEDVGNIDVFKVFKDQGNVNSPSVIPANKYDKVVIEDVKDEGNGDYFEIYKAMNNF